MAPTRRTIDWRRRLDGRGLQDLGQLEVPRLHNSYYQQLVLAPLGGAAVRELFEGRLGRDPSIAGLADAASPERLQETADTVAAGRQRGGLMVKGPSPIAAAGSRG
jgi:hypothetical protein